MKSDDYYKAEEKYKAFQVYMLEETELEDEENQVATLFLEDYFTDPVKFLQIDEFISGFVKLIKSN